MEFNRRSLLKSSALAGIALGLPILNTKFLVNPANAAEGKVLKFLSAETLTGNWDPSSHTTLAQINLESFVFGYLTRAPMTPEKPDELVMELATEMKLIDEHTLEFKLREGVTFHDGKPFKAEDVKATFEYASRPDRPAAWYPGPCEVEVVSDYVARVKTDKAGYPASLFWFLSSFLPIMSAKDVADPKTLSARPNGTGGFKFVKQDGNTTVLEAFDGFYLGKPTIPGLHFSFVGDATTRTLALLNGEADLIERLEAEQVETIQKTGGFQLHKAISVENKYLWFRCSKAPFNDWRLRRAVCHAIDRSVIDDILGVSGHASNCYVSPVKFGYVDIPNYPTYDPDQCQKLLAEAGFPKGQGLPELEYITSVGFYPKTKEYAEAITAMLQEQGFPVKLNVMEVAAWGDALYDRPGGGPGHMIDCGWSTGSPEPDLVLRTHFHSTTHRICGIQDPEIDAALDKERNASKPEERKKVIQTELMPLLATKAPAFSLFTSVFIHGMRDGLSGLYIYPNGMMDANKATLA
ncbi:ABC transporter substrate-binding protein [Rhizobium rhizogenes]|uniref:ABC transporter substrate-binding protein n=1 Tax=Rhizobium rhizogenes TaxID=359 RepID=UPI0022B61DD7|nr:ABC transporter substrate-binding protein [Rhizobium rhizogenes]MCZ7448240.1 ABC transporter substrate-binding protein [Rhizobium rhizogenes]MCZ7465901.1 ABC transporter substrate-binding protein [Rhizobium rhizogenes]